MAPWIRRCVYVGVLTSGLCALLDAFLCIQDVIGFAALNTNFDAQSEIEAGDNTNSTTKAYSLSAVFKRILTSFGLSPLMFLPFGLGWYVWRWHVFVHVLSRCRVCISLCRVCIVVAWFDLCRVQETTVPEKPAASP